ncbi:TRAP transporter permease [Pseudooceanicola aestuarii]|uniref:TRAP transporter permease n=1 Tax=Pseudooceanicola aestuarii TaxID=2697319 RepID=UPI0013D8AC00|nr:TRAP transporter permease [Pseudooceanicola aestuarii]
MAQLPNAECSPDPSTEDVPRSWRRAVLLISAIAVTMGSFHIYTAGFGMLEPMLQRSLHVTFALVLAFLIYSPPQKFAHPGEITWSGYVLAALSVLPMLWLYLDYDRILNRIEYVDRLTTLDQIMAVLLIALIVEAARRVIGWAMAIVVLVAIVYAFVGPWLPGGLSHRGLSWQTFLDQQVMTMNGVFTTPIAVSATYVVIFIMFGAFLVKTGMGETIINMAQAFTGHTKGGPAKVAVISSAFFGSINGSSVANVVSTGSFTIPLMHGIGYRPHFAAAVETVASVGGQFTPPVMGAAAFIMVEITGIGYGTILLAATIPAMLYFAAVLFAVHLEAGRLELPVLEKKTWAEAGRIMIDMIPFLVPVTVLIYLLMDGASPIKAGFWALVSLFVTAMARKSTRLSVKGILEALEVGARNAALIAVTCAAAGIVIGVVNGLGVGVKFASTILSFSQGIPILALALVMVASIILGMGLPTSAAYVIVASVAAPPLVELGLSQLAAHMFVLFFACLSSMTPPVAIASYAAAGLAGADPSRTGFTAVRIGLAGFLIPYLFVFSPALLMDGSAFQIAMALTTGLFGVAALAIATIGWAFVPVNFVMRLIMGGLGMCMLTPGMISNSIGAIGVTACLVYFHRTSRAAQNEQKTA